MQGGDASLDVSYPALPASVADARSAVASLADLAGAGEQELHRIRLAVSEAVSNAVVHAYGKDEAGAVHVTAAVIDAELSVVIADDGCGLGAAPKSLGLGLGMALMTQMCDSLTFTTRSSGGTQVEMRLRLAQARPAQEPATHAQGDEAPWAEAAPAKAAAERSPDEPSRPGASRRGPAI